MRSISMTALTNEIQRWWPGATVWGKGDPAHQESSSDHNEDDTPGSKPEQTDADSVPEHRALDVPTQGPISMSTLDTIVQRLIGRPANARRLRYVILRQTIWRKRAGWVPEVYRGEYHDHLHVSGDVVDDENGAPYDLGPDAPAPEEMRGIDMFLIHKVVNGVMTFGLIGPDVPLTWKETDVLQTSEGPIGGQDYANAWARGVGDSRRETPLVFAALTQEGARR